MRFFVSFNTAPRRYVVVGLIASLSLIAPAGATADQIDPEPADHGHGHHDEDGSSDATPYTVDSEAEELGDVPVEPGSLEGMAPDLEDLPGEWLGVTEAEKITPSTGMPSKDTFGADINPSTDAVPAPPTKSLPRTLDAAPGWQYSYSCDPNDKPGMVAFAELVSQHYDRPRYYTSRSCKVNNTSQHGEGRAVDWSMDAYDSADKAIGDAVASWLTANNGEMARRFGVQSVIWNRRSWYLYSPGSWRTYTGPSPHTDHLHISFTWDGAMKRTSWWDGTPVTTVDHGTCRVFAGAYAPRYAGRNTRSCSTNLPNPPPASYPVTLPGARGSNVSTAQRYLGFTGSEVDGSFGPSTTKSLLAYQRRNDLPWTGVLDKSTWSYMESAGVPTVSSTAVSRLAGTNRYRTAAEIAAQYPKGGRVYVTTGENYPDALAASAAAGTYDNPVLLTGKSTLPTATRRQLSRIDPWRIYVVGGRGAVNSSVYSALKQYAGNGGVRRLSDSNRYGTAAEVSERFSSGVSVAYISTGGDFPDALVGAARAGRNNGPMLLTRSGALPSETKAALRRLKPGRITIVGSYNSVSGAVERELKRYAGSGGVYRVGGGNSHQVAANLAGYYPRGVDVVYLATSSDYPDALTGAARAGSMGGPVLLTRKYSLPSATKDALSDLNPDRIVILGGTGVVSGAVESDAERYTG
ncbi:MAG: cell wall-binding repeat-containing protein [Ornithinimicrobium sp.]